MAQVKYKDPRKAADRREYFRQYHEQRKAGLDTTRKVDRRQRGRRERVGPSFGDLRAAIIKRNRYLEEFGGWPERRALHPESIAETIAKR